MSRRIYFDGLNLSLERGTGIATYTRMLPAWCASSATRSGSSTARRTGRRKIRCCARLRFLIPAMRLMCRGTAGPTTGLSTSCSHIRGVKPAPVIAERHRRHRSVPGSPAAARSGLCRPQPVRQCAPLLLLERRGSPTSISTARPDILHCTYQMPIRAKGACNVYTIHDLVPLRLPFTTLDNKRQTYRLLRKIAREADHIVTVSEHSRRDIIELLGVDEKRVTNTYEAVEFPRELVERPDDVVAEQLAQLVSARSRDYLLFYGALEPKKNVQRLIEAYHAVGRRYPAGHHRRGRLGQPDREPNAKATSREDERRAATPRSAGSTISNMPACRCS